MIQRIRNSLFNKMIGSTPSSEKTLQREQIINMEYNQLIKYQKWISISALQPREIKMLDIFRMICINDL